ncbi:phospho-sugar mutase [uncultured Corynebacterium sp.]|uniref:phospho-sugar mutase n=1 Tax=uncultured Corynebacterium sp. TaxID=159447 RepID=UPI0025DCF828|nr:phospho-sugar mutase [uncultured Corynebacterium sp.]
MTSVLDTARKWAEHDPDPVTRAEIETLIDTHDEDALRPMFAGPLSFGTAGLRGKIGPGESQMNRAVVIRTTAGLMDVLKKHVDVPKVVVGCDARHGSADFHRDVANVVAAAGGHALLLPPQNPTPLTAFTVRELGADAGVMVTASHNPPQDNGYKVYLGGRVVKGDGQGVQIVPPFDTEIAAAIAAAPAADEVSRDAADGAGVVEEIDTREQYLARIKQRVTDGPRQLRITLTPMHGVGGDLALKALEAVGFGEVELVAQQAQPDPEFPTVAFPNPEEPGALDCAIAAAREAQSDIIVALDPDADRCAVAVPDGDSWRQLTGDETGALLGGYLACQGGVLANSVVSSRFLGRIAEARGAQWHTTLTGFKWIARTPRLTFGYEEAIGYCCDPEAVADKDGISAAVTIACLAAELKSEGKSLQGRLDELAAELGTYKTKPLTFRFDDITRIAPTLEHILQSPPQALAGSRVTSASDMSQGYHGLDPTPGLVLETEANDRVIIRPSGTEPKLKCYLEVVREGAVDWTGAEDRLSRISTDLRQALGL